MTGEAIATAFAAFLCVLTVGVWAVELWREWRR